MEQIDESITSDNQVIVPTGAGCGCGGSAPSSCSCKGSSSQSAEPSYIYALGTIKHIFPNLSVEKEFAQVSGRLDKKEREKLTQAELVHKVLSDKENRYLARQLCWKMSIQGIDTYLLVPQDLSDLDIFIESLRPRPDFDDTDLVIGRKVGISTPDFCNGLVLPMVSVTQSYSFKAEALLSKLVVPAGVDAKKFADIAKTVFMGVMQLADNAGSSDEHRAINYLAVRYPDIYTEVVNLNGQDYSLSAVNTVPSRLATNQKILDVILTFENRNGTGVVEKRFVRVNVSGEFPFLVSNLQRYFDR